MKNKKFSEDDNRQIADMSGTYAINYFGFLGIRKRLLNKKNKTSETSGTKVNQPPLTKRETRKLMINALLGGLAIGSVFVILVGLFILFCVFIWF